MYIAVYVACSAAICSELTVILNDKIDWCIFINVC